MSNRVAFFIVEYDVLGILLWTIGVGLLTTALSLSEKMQAGIGIWMAALLVGGSLAIVSLVAWEVWLNNGLKTKKSTEHQFMNHENPRQKEHNNSIRIPNSRTLHEHVTILGPAGLGPAGQVAAQISARIIASQGPVNRTKWWRFGSFRERSHPLFRTRLLKRRTIPLGCLIGSLAGFAMKAGAWAVWERPENLPLDYKKVVEFIQGKEVLANVYNPVYS